MSDFDGARARVAASTGLPGSGVSAAEKLDITTRLTTLEALPVPPSSITQLADVSDTAATEGQIYQMVGGVLTPVDVPTKTITTSVSFMIDGGGAAIATGTKGVVTIPFAGTITEWQVLADQSGLIQLDIWKDALANYPPTVADTITGTDKPRITAGSKGGSTALTGWTKAVSYGDILRYNVDSATTIQRVTVTLFMTRVI
jgi:hypothetical protein